MNFVGCWSGPAQGGLLRTGQRVAVCGRGGEDAWLDRGEQGQDEEDPTRGDGEGGRKGNSQGQSVYSAAGGRKMPSVSKQPWMDQPNRLYIPEELWTDPVFKWEVQGLMVRYFMGRLDEDYAEEIKNQRKDRPEVSEEDLKNREDYKKAAMQAIKENPKEWLLRNWRTGEAIDVSTVYKNPLVMQGTDPRALERLATQPPLVDPAVLEELDEIAKQELLIKQKGGNSGEVELEQCWKCGKEVPKQEMEEYGTCEFCRRIVAIRKREERKRLMEQKLGDPSEISFNFPSRDWPRMPACDSIAAQDFLSQYMSSLADATVEKDSIKWLLGGDLRLYSASVPTLMDGGEDQFLSLAEQFDLSSAGDEIDKDDEEDGDDDGDDGDDGEGDDSAEDSCANLPEALSVLTRKICELSGPHVTEERIALASGARGAFRAVLQVLCKPGENILLPEPSDGAFEAIASSLNVEVRYYAVIPDSDRQWGLNIRQIKTLIDAKTTAVVVQNPGPIGGYLLSEEELTMLVDVCLDRGLPIISDEVREDLVFSRRWLSSLKKTRIPSLSSGEEFIPMAQVAKELVPVITIKEISHRFAPTSQKLGWLMLDADTLLMNDRIRLSLKRMGAAQLPPDLNLSVGSILPYLDPQRIADAEMTVENTCKSLKILVERTHEDIFSCILPYAGDNVLVKIDLEALNFQSIDQFTDYARVKARIGIVPGSVFHAPNFCFLQTSQAARTGNDYYPIRLLLDERVKDVKARKFSK